MPVYKPLDSPNRPNIQRLKERHREIMRRLVMGQKASGIARDLGMRPSSVSIIINSPAFREELKRLSASADDIAKDVRKRIDMLSIEAVNKMEQVLSEEMNAVNMRLQIDVAKDILNRSGHTPTNKSIGAIALLTQEDIEKMKERMQGNVVIEGEIEEEKET